MLPLLLALAAPTFYGDILPLFEARCLKCHQSGEAAPMALLTYSQARPYAKAIHQAVTTHSMPPGGGLTDREIDLLAAWARRPLAGAARSARVAPRVEVRSDLVVRMDQPFTVHPGQTVDYQYFVLPTDLEQPRWVQAIEIRPSNRQLLHHAVAFVRSPRSRFLRGGPLSVEDEVIATYLPGSDPMRLPSGQAKLLPAHSEIVLELHYTAESQVASDRSEVHLEFASAPPRERIYTLSVADWSFEIPAFAAAHPARAVFTVETPVRVLAVTPHMHLRGRSMRVAAVTPFDDRYTLLDVPRYRFDWQIRQVLSRPLDLPARTRIEVDATFDNSPNNKRNPDPAATVTWGEQSWQEMLVAFVDVAIPAALPAEEIYRKKPL